MDFKSPTLRFEFSSPVIPPMTFDYKVSSRELLCLDAKMPINTDYDPNDYTCECVYVPSTYTKTMSGCEPPLDIEPKDQFLEGVKLPLTIAYKKGLPLNGRNPTLIRVYGAYGHNNDVHWRSSDAFLMSKGLEATFFTYLQRLGYCTCSRSRRL